MTNDTGFWTEAEPYTGRCRCSCGATYRADTPEHADRWLEEHTFAHEVIAGVAS